MSNMNSPQGIEIENLSLSFGNTKVLKDVNLNIHPGEFFSFLGPSGSGKSTLLRAIAGFGPKPNGRILVGGQDIVQLPAHKRNIGMVFQNYALWPHMTVSSNVAFGLVERKLPKKEITEKVGKALELVGLSHLAARHPNELSGGQQQRVALARTLAVEPKVLLLDEPLSNLDANLRVQMRRDILKLQRELGLTTIFVTHDQEEANTTSDRLAVLSDGIVQQAGKPVDLYDRPANRFVADFLGSANILDGDFKDNKTNCQFTSSNGLQIKLGKDYLGEGSLVFRPQNVQVQRDGKAEGDIILQGKVIYREFLGSQVRYGIDVQGHIVAVDEFHFQDKALIQEGQNITLSISEKDTICVAA